VAGELAGTALAPIRYDNGKSGPGQVTT
jgi:hypothetical protein